MEYNIFLIKNQIMRGKYEHFLVKSVSHGDFPDFFRRKKLLYKIVYILNSTKTHYGVRPHCCRSAAQYTVRIYNAV